MKWYALTHLGAEKALKQELNQYGIEGLQLQGACEFQATNEQVGQFIFYTQVATRILLATGSGSLEEIDMGESQKQIQDKSFKVETKIIPGGPKITANEVSASIGDRLQGKVDLEKPEITIFCLAGRNTLLGVDIAGDLSKRYYRVFGNSRSIKGTLAAAILWTYPVSGEILDPFGNTGEIMIEAAMRFSKTSPLRYKKHQKIAVIDEQRKEWNDQTEQPTNTLWCLDPRMPNLRSAQKNAKLAGVEKFLQFSRLTPDWMDIKFEEATVDTVITMVPPITQRNSDEAHIKELFYQAEFVLKKDGSIIVAAETEDTTTAILRYAKDYKFTLKNETVIFSGKLGYHVMQFEL